ncbi:MAG: hypothetical protein AB1765_06385 [Candidatus Hydrogenedentota bacterium]
MNAYEELLVLLAKNNIRYIIVGGLACALNGYVRPTIDVDILIEYTSENINNLLKTLTDYKNGYAKELKVEDFTDEEGAIRIIEDFPIDIFVKISGYYYKDILEYIRYKNIENYNIPYLDKKMLIILKNDSLREIDKIDVINLKELPD